VREGRCLGIGKRLDSERAEASPESATSRIRSVLRELRARTCTPVRELHIPLQIVNSPPRPVRILDLQKSS